MRERDRERERERETEGGRKRGRERDVEYVCFISERNDGCLGTFYLSSCLIIASKASGQSDGIDYTCKH